MVEVEICNAERDEMRDLAERLAEIDDELWNSPSLCAQWRIRDVLAHLTAGAEGAFGFGWILRSTLRHGLNYNRWVAADGQRTRSTGSSGHVCKHFGAPRPTASLRPELGRSEA